MLRLSKSHLTKSHLTKSRWLAAGVAALAMLVVVAGHVDARPSGGGSFGSRGTRTFSAPAATRTAPNTAAPITRSVTQPRPATPGPVAGGATGRPGFFGGGLMGGLAAGFIGAGLFGMLFGHGLFGGLGGSASILGLLLQLAVIYFVARLAWTWWQRRNGLAPAAAGAASFRDAYASNPTAQGAAAGGAGFATGAVNPTPADFDAFEGLLEEVSLAFGREDLRALRSQVTPEMLGYFSEELSKNASRGVVNEVSDVKLLQGDLAEAWREGDIEYATVAMRYSLIDRDIDRASGKPAASDNATQEVTELWTFMRARGANWLVSAIQQA